MMVLLESSSGSKEGCKDFSLDSDVFLFLPHTAAGHAGS